MGSRQLQYFVIDHCNRTLDYHSVSIDHHIDAELVVMMYRLSCVHKCLFFLLV